MILRDETADSALREGEEGRSAAAVPSKLEEAIRRSALEWRLTFDALASPLLLLETDGRIIRMNEAARALAGVTFDAAIHRPLSILEPAQPWRAIAGLLSQAAGAFAVTDTKPQAVTARQRDDQDRTWELSVSPVAGLDGQRWLVVVLLDITDHVKLQESLRRSETMSAMGALVAGVSHEVRNPLFGISATLDAFEARFKDQTEYRRYFDILQGEVKRLSELMQHLLDYGKPLRLELAEVSAQEVATAAVGACIRDAQQAEVEIVQEVAPGVPSLIMDRTRLVQVFQNLVENAVQHSPRGGRITFRVEPAEESPGADREAVRLVVFSIEDSGPGFREEDLPHIFEPFFTRRRGGTGLGLSIVQRILEQHGGEIGAANLPGGGAVMTVRLPLSPARRE